MTTTSKKLKDQILSPQTLDAMRAMIAERSTNMALAMRAGASSAEILMAELVTIEIKMDALIMLLDSLGTADFSRFDEFMRASAKIGELVSLQIRKDMRAAGEQAGARRPDA